MRNIFHHSRFIKLSYLISLEYRCSTLDFRIYATHLTSLQPEVLMQFRLGVYFIFTFPGWNEVPSLRFRVSFSDFVLNSVPRVPVEPMEGWKQNFKNLCDVNRYPWYKCVWIILQAVMINNITIIVQAISNVVMLCYYVIECYYSI